MADEVAVYRMAIEAAVGSLILKDFGVTQFRHTSPDVVEVISRAVDALLASTSRLSRRRSVLVLFECFIRPPTVIFL